MNEEEYEQLYARVNELEERLAEQKRTERVYQDIATTMVMSARHREKICPICEERRELNTFQLQNERTGKICDGCVSALCEALPDKVRIELDGIPNVY